MKEYLVGRKLGTFMGLNIIKVLAPVNTPKDTVFKNIQMASKYAQMPMWCDYDVTQEEVFEYFLTQICGYEIRDFDNVDFVCEW